MINNKKTLTDSITPVEIIKSRKYNGSEPWWQLVWKIEKKDDYLLIKDLWLNHAEGKHNNLSIIRSVARAALICGYHDDCRNLIKKAITNALSNKKKNFVKKIIFIIKKPLKNKIFTIKASFALKNLNCLCESINVKLFLISGTLLGYLRDGKIIGWDKDIDVGFFTEDIKPDKLKSFFAEHPDFQVAPVDITSDRIRIKHKTGIAIDVFPHYLEDDRRWHDGTATRWWNTEFKLKKARFLRTDFYIPENPDLYLVENYATWQIPDPNFDARIDAPNAQVTDQECLETLYYYGLLDSIKKNKSVMIKRYCELLKEIGEDSWIDNILKSVNHSKHFASHR